MMASRYRNKVELEQAEHAEPIKRLKTFLLQKEFWNQQQDQVLIKKIKSTSRSSGKKLFRYKSSTS